MTDGAPSPPIDHTTLKALEADTSRDLMPELVQVFLKSAGARIAQITDHAAAGRLDGIAAEAHALKSSSATFGASEVRWISAELEAASKAGDQATIERLAAGLDQALDAAQAALEDYVREISG